MGSPNIVKLNLFSPPADFHAVNIRTNNVGWWLIWNGLRNFTFIDAVRFHILFELTMTSLSYSRAGYPLLFVFWILNLTQHIRLTFFAAFCSTFCIIVSYSASWIMASSRFDKPTVCCSLYNYYASNLFISIEFKYIKLVRQNEANNVMKFK